MFSTRSLAIQKRMLMNNMFAMQKQAMFKPGLMTQVAARRYHENVIDHYEKPRNVGVLDAKDKTVGTGLVGAPACGDVMKLQIQVDENGNKIQKAVFKVSLFSLH